MKILLGGDTLATITYEQFQLARRANISLTESTDLPCFEFEAYLNMLLKDIKQEADAVKAQATLR